MPTILTMPTILQDYNLSHLNTMALCCQADYAVFIDHADQLPAVLSALPSDYPVLVLSGGSNVLLPKRLHAAVLLPKMQGIHVVDDHDDSVIIKVAAGENWHNLVLYCTQNGWYGLENLALIPGLAGAAPIQNIGAYGVQLDSVLFGIDSVDLKSRQSYFLDKADCNFGYRYSSFKDSLKHHLITDIYLKLHKNPKRINTDYGDLATVAQQFAGQDQFADQNQHATPTPRHVIQAVIAIRQSKLPDPAVLPNCGSFFQNPVIGMAQFYQLKQRFSDLPHYPIDDNWVKIAAGWLIDKAGLKGNGIAPIFTHDKQALVLTNHTPHHATQADILATQDFICRTIYDKFGISLVREPVLVSANGQF